MKLSVRVGSTSQEGLPFIVVKTRVRSSGCVQYFTLRIVVELDPKAIELDVLE